MSIFTQHFENGYGKGNGILGVTVLLFFLLAAKDRKPFILYSKIT
jgi:hypothetical protein